MVTFRGDIFNVSAMPILKPYSKLVDETGIVVSESVSAAVVNTDILAGATDNVELG